MENSKLLLARTCFSRRCSKAGGKDLRKSGEYPIGLGLKARLFEIC